MSDHIGEATKKVIDLDALEKLAKAGLEGIEVDHTDHDAHARELLTELGARTGLIRTGSSDYHGTGKTGHDLGSATTRASAFDELLRRIQAHGGQID